MRRPTRMLLSAVMACVLAGSLPATASAADACSMGDAPVSELSEFGAQFVTICLINQQRGAAGAVPLSYNPKLFLAGHGHVVDMDTAQYFAHAAPDGSRVADRVAAQHYAPGGDATQIGEDLAWGNATLSTPRATVKAWMNSPTHRAAILDPAYREIGVGVRLGAPLAITPTGESALYAAVFGVIHAPRVTARSRSRARAPRTDHGRGGLSRRSEPPVRVVNAAAPRGGSRGR